MTEFRPGRFQILPTVIKNLIIINVLVFAAQKIIGANSLFFENTFALHTWQSPFFKPWQFFTYMFLHGSIPHIFGNMFALWMFGATLENLWGPKRFLTFYLVCGLGAALCHMAVLYFENQPLVEALKYVDPAQRQELLSDPLFKLNGATLGASGAVFGCLAAFGYLFADEYIYLYLFIPIKAKWFVLAYIGGELMLQIENSAGDTVAHMAHLGGALIGFLMVYFWKNNNRRNFY
ncbi:MAG TPA: rhomboid family intramembrane serine protease [Chitinophagaceae bacterium]|nr:rhomboid family intramembrane serine protease [Chitinophagaceae bacterium]